MKCSDHLDIVLRHARARVWARPQVAGRCQIASGERARMFQVDEASRKSSESVRDKSCDLRPHSNALQTSSDQDEASMVFAATKHVAPSKGPSQSVGEFDSG